MRRIRRNIQLFTMHLHDAEIDYTNVFSQLYAIPAKERVTEFRDIIYAISSVDEAAGEFKIKAISADKAALPVVYNQQTGLEQNLELNESEYVGNITHLYANPEKRIAAVEYVKSGPKSDLIATTIENILRTHVPELRKLKLSFSPLLSSNLLAEIDKLERIRQAYVTLTRPNLDWEDHDDNISRAINESGGTQGTLTVTAGRGESLAKKKGLMQVIRDAIMGTHPNIKEAGVVGSTSDSTPEKTIRSNKYIEGEPINVQSDSTGNVASDDIFSRMATIVRQKT